MNFNRAEGTMHPAPLGDDVSLMGRTRHAGFLLVTRYSLLVTLLLAFALRVHHLGTQSLWNDEGSSFVQATRTLAEIAYHAGRDIHPPGYYWLLAGWRVLAGESEYALRLLSTFASLLTVALTAALARQLYGGIAAVAAALFVALNSFSIYYAQEARMYALLALWGTASLWVLAGLLKPRDAAPLRLTSIMALGLVNAGGLYTQYGYIYVLLTQAVVVVLWLIAQVAAQGQTGGVRAMRNAVDSLAAVVGAQVLALGLFLPWLPTALTQIAAWPNTGQAVETAQALNMILNWLVYGVTAQGELLAVAWILAIFGLTLVTWTPNAPPQSGAQARTPPQPALWAAFLPATWVIVSVGVFMAQGLFRENNLKFLLPAQVGMALWMGRGVAALWNGWLIGRDGSGPNRRRRVLGRLLAVGAALLIVSAAVRGLDPLYHDPAYQRADYRAMARLAETELSTGDIIILNGPNQAEVFNYYYRGDAQVIGLPAGLGGDDAAARAETEALISPAGGQQFFALFWGDRERDPNGVVEGVLDRETYSLSDTWYGDVRLARYAVGSISRPCSARDAVFGRQIVLSCAGFANNAQQAGTPLLVHLEWRGGEALAARYKVFVQLLNSEGLLFAQHDGEPGGGLRPTTDWQPGEVIVDRHGLLIPPDIPPGDYTLIAGMYAVEPPNARLTLPDGSDYVVLERVTLR